MFSSAGLTEILSVIGAFVGTLTATLMLLTPMFRSMKSLNKKLDTFFRDWEGTPAEPGRDAVPGVMERLNKLDGELSKNSGKSVKDAVARIEKRMEEGNKKFAELEVRIKNIEAKLGL